MYRLKNIAKPAKVKLSGIPMDKFCVGVSRSNKLVSKGIMLYSKYKEKIPKEFLASHSFAMFDRSVYESNSIGNQERHITKYVNKGHEFWLFSNTYISKIRHDVALAHAKGSVGRLYDYPGFMRFVFSFIPQLKYADFCSEYVARIVQEYLRLPFIPLPPEDITPSAILQYLMKLKSGWQLECHYKDGIRIS